jgi:hypothetical protein
MLLLAAFTPLPSPACTLFAAAGTAADGGGTLIAKNRDWLPDHRQQLVVLAPAGGYPTLALEAVGGPQGGIKAAVNSQGLAIVSATAGQVPLPEREAVPQQKQLTARLLTTCADVDEVLARIDLFRRPAFYLVADRREIAVIEVGPDGRRAVARRRNETLVHTNHYCALEPTPALRGPGSSSLERYDRIRELVQGPVRPFTLEDFVRFSEDRSAGPDNSIWRTGRSEGKRRTLATWIVSIPPSGSPMLYVKTADPGEPERTCRVTVADALRRKDHERIPLGDWPCSAAAIVSKMGN